MKNTILLFSILTLVFACSQDSDPNPGEVDMDKDGIADNIDNCPTIENADQSDVDKDRIGDVCDNDFVEGTRNYTSIASNFVYDNYNYPVQIFLPKGYETNKNLPIIYILDGTLNFETVVSLLGSNRDAIVVGVGDMASNGDWRRRWEDLMPGVKCHNTIGKHLDFYKFITQELVPYIDDNYENDHTSRSLIGHSSAGLFSLVAMFLEDSKDMLFLNFIASDPELGCDPDYFSEMLDTSNLSMGAKKFKLYLALSNDGNIVEVRKFADNIQVKEFAWLSFRYEEFLNDNHMGIVNPSFKLGLKFIFEQ